MWHSRLLPPFMAKAILNFHFDYLKASLTHDVSLASKQRTKKQIGYALMDSIYRRHYVRAVHTHPGYVVEPFDYDYDYVDYDNDDDQSDNDDAVGVDDEYFLPIFPSWPKKIRGNSSYEKLLNAIRILRSALFCPFLWPHNT